MVNAQVLQVTEADARLLVDSRCELGEGILWCDRRNVLYWTDILAARLWRYDPASGHSQYWQLHEPLGCLALANDGRLLLGLANGLHAADPEAQLQDRELSLQLLAHVEADNPNTRINDGRADRHGNFVFGTKSDHADGRRGGSFYQWSVGKGLRRLPLPHVAIPNAICFSPDGERIYFCDSPQANIITGRYDPQSALVEELQAFASLSEPGIEPDGAVVDVQGRVWNAQWGAGRVACYSADGRIEQLVHIPTQHASCCVLAPGALYISSARVGLDAAALSAQPDAGGIFVWEHPQLKASVDRVELP
ncbi:SMP-30/gluconolactonase/LRE family protein [Stenotrophomonas sp. PS02298]|uniref:SMP-30/gluconolactonase/LRE family protein n=1 Tax=Stenotrophomonas sp. PS02298 TaxID=2991424 RepID=UPI00249BA27A|nr:SMP-30/gluconolactonase/LRE family protein [Stenotrophomonas sp. PS02298]